MSKNLIIYYSRKGQNYWNGSIKELKKGKISPDPIAYKDRLPCIYCDFKALCKNASPLSYRSVSKEDGKALREELANIRS